MQICCWNLAKVLKHQTAQFYSVCMLPILVVYFMYLFGHFEILPVNPSRGLVRKKRHQTFEKQFISSDHKIDYNIEKY